MQHFYDLRISIILLLLANIASAQLVGEALYCSREGDKIDIPSILLEGNPCLSCHCKSHTVQCRSRAECPIVDGCYRLMNKGKKECCKLCLGCKYNGRNILHNSKWNDRCQEFTCLAGVLTNTTTQCHVPCAHPQPPKYGSCCQTCKSCWFEGKEIGEGQYTNSGLDPCVKCICTGGTLHCSKKACPVLSCPAYRTELDSDGCCPYCIGTRDYYTLPGGHCFLERYIYYANKTRSTDPCTACTCMAGYLYCSRETCPPLQCSAEYRVITPGKCCAECVRRPQTQACVSQGAFREHGETWRLGKCSTCRCKDGKVLCQADFCEYHSKSCPPGYLLQESLTECCPNCVKEKPGVCMTFGDPHYRTFDGYLFNFQGECRYDLVYDCKGRTFSVRVINDARQSSFFTWTRRLSVKIETKDYKYRVSLGQKLRIKVDKKRTKIPFKSEGLSIVRRGFAAELSTAIGLNVLWDGATYVEIQLDPIWRNSTCGLCGNFNGNSSDDKLMKNGDFATNDEDMANSWLAGKPRACLEKLKDLKEKKEEIGMGLRRTQRLTCVVSRKESLKRCEVLQKSIFSKCHNRIDVKDFYSSCLMDICECPPSRMCECDSVTAYARACQKAGIEVDDYRTETQCGGFDCPHGSMYMACAPACKATCRNPYPNPDCHMRRCKPGCFCPFSTVLHRGACILPEKCKKWKNRRLLTQ